MPFVLKLPPDEARAETSMASGAASAVEKKMVLPTTPVEVKVIPPAAAPSPLPDAPPEAPAPGMFRVSSPTLVLCSSSAAATIATTAGEMTVALTEALAEAAWTGCWQQ